MPHARAFHSPDRPLPAGDALTLADVGRLAQRLQQAGQADAAVALYRQWIGGGPLPMAPGVEARTPAAQPVAQGRTEAVESPAGLPPAARPGAGVGAGAGRLGSAR